MPNIGISEFRKKLAQTHALISTSYHEAGHAIQGLLCGFKITCVYIFEEKTTKRIDGWTHYNYQAHESVVDKSLVNPLLEAEICFRYAGLVSERHHFKMISGSNKFPMFLKEGSSDDIVSANWFVQENKSVTPGKKRYAFKKRLINRTHRNLIRHWDGVTAVAHALFESKRLNFEDLRTILTKNTKNKAFWKSQFAKIDIIYEKEEELDENMIKFILLS